MNVNLEHNEGLYLIHTRELHTLQKNIYKIGRSYKLYDRIKQYPKTSKIMFIINCKESVLREKNLILLFKSKFIQKLDYGTEYFQGDIDDMIKEIFNYIYNNKTIDSKIVAKVDNKVAKIAKNKKVAKVAKVANVVNIDNKVAKKVAKKVDNKVDNVVNVANKVDITDTFDKVANKVNNADNIDTVDKVDNKVNRTCPTCKHEFKYPSLLHLCTFKMPIFIKKFY